MSPAASTVAANTFIAQLIGQQARLGGALTERSDGPAMGSQAYRRAGADPVLFGGEPRFLRIAA